MIIEDYTPQNLGDYHNPRTEDPYTLTSVKKWFLGILKTASKNITMNM